MIDVECPHCHKKYSLSREKLGQKSRVKLKCKNCNHSFEFSVSGDGAGAAKVGAQTGERDISLDVGGATMLGAQFSKERDTAPYFFPDDCSITLTYTLAGKEYTQTLNKKLTVIGRTEGDMVINDSLISRKHASIEVKNATMVELKDLASKNGTLHNGMPVTSVLLQSGDNIQVGSTVMTYSNDIKF